jgi:hypothetical protein
MNILIPLSLHIPFTINFSSPTNTSQLQSENIVEEGNTSQKVDIFSSFLLNDDPLMVFLFPRMKFIFGIEETEIMFSKHFKLIEKEEIKDIINIIICYLFIYLLERKQTINR